MSRLLSCFGKPNTLRAQGNRTNSRDNTPNTSERTSAPAPENRGTDDSQSMRYDSPHSGIQESSPSGNLDASRYPTAGKGLCIIMANCIPTLPGYEKDIQSLKNLFECDMFDFDVKTELPGSSFRNLSSKQFRIALSNIQLFLTKNGKYDKFLMFVLSHGTEKGIIMCEEGTDGREDEKCNNEVCVITQEEIINTFTHDNVASLKDVPKCFFFQACRGGDNTRAAAKVVPNSQSDNEEDKPIVLPSITRKDILVAHATMHTKLCYVSNKDGSWFLKNLVYILRKQSERKDIFEMLTELAALTSDETLPKFFACNSAHCVIKVFWENELCPVTVFGKAKLQSSTAKDDQLRYRPVFVSENTYTGFAQTEDLTLCSYKFKGKILCLQSQGMQTMCNDWVPAESLKAFENTKHFQIFGQLRLDNQNVETEEGPIKIIGNTWETDPISRDCKENHMEVVVRVKYQGNMVDVDQTTLKGKAFVYVNDMLHHTGPLIQSAGVWGVNGKDYQLPIFTSTLTKQLFLAKLNKHQNMNEIIEKELAWREKKDVEDLLKEVLEKHFKNKVEKTPTSSFVPCDAEIIKANLRPNAQGEGDN